MIGFQITSLSRVSKGRLLFSVFKTTPGYIVCILIPFLILILIQGINCIRLFRRYKHEQEQEIKEERAKIEEERAENQKMMEELLALKAQLSKQDNDNNNFEIKGEENGTDTEQ